MKFASKAFILSLFLLISPAFALNISISTDKTRIFYGDAFVLSGRITFDNGSTDVFDYRAAVVAPGKIIICDSNKTRTASDGLFSLRCNVPSLNESISLGIPAAATRAVIPLRAGIAVLDTAKATIVKKHAKAVLAVNKDKFAARVDALAADIDKFINKTGVILTECDKLMERAQKFNLTNVSESCQTIKDKTNAIIANAMNISAEAKKLKDNIDAVDLKDFRDGLSIVKDDMKELRDELKGLRESIKAIKWNLLKEIKEIKKEERAMKHEERKLAQQEELRKRIENLRSKLGEGL